MIVSFRNMVNFVQDSSWHTQKQIVQITVELSSTAIVELNRRAVLNGGYWRVVVIELII